MQHRRLDDDEREVEHGTMVRVSNNGTRVTLSSTDRLVVADMI